jgi:hypothetical protein
MFDSAETLLNNVSLLGTALLLLLALALVSSTRRRGYAFIGAGEDPRRLHQPRGAWGSRMA